jgi:Ca2+-binding RTX toxin-like protein
MGNDTVGVLVSGYALPDNVENGIVYTLAATTLSGNSGANDLTGNGGVDTLFGGGEVDRLFGNGNNDILEGGAGADWLTGGAGNDTFVLRRGDASGDTLVDFNGGGAYAGDLVRFVGYGPGAYLTQAGMNCAVHAGDGSVVDIFRTLTGPFDPSDYYFV